MKSWRVSVKLDPSQSMSAGGDGMILIPAEAMEFFDWKTGTQLRLEAGEGGLKLMRYHRRQG